MKQAAQAGPQRGRIATILVGAYLLLSMLLFIVFDGAQRRSALLDRLLFEQEIGRILSMTRLVPLFQGNIDLENINMYSPIEILGAGFYDDAGELIYGMGEHPLNAVRPRNEETEFRRVGSSNVFEYYRSFADRDIPGGNLRLLLPGFRPRTPEIPESQAGSDNRRPGLSAAEGLPGNVPDSVYLLARISEPGPGYNQLWLLYAVLEIILGILFAVFGRMYYRNHQYRMQIEAQRQLVHLGQAARTLTHEIKNPLSAIGLRVNLLRKRGVDETREDLDVIQEELDRLNELSSRIREFLKNPAGNPELVDLGDFTRELVKRFPMASLVVNRPDENSPYLISADPARLRSIIENLMLNAQESQRDSTVEVELTRQRNAIVLSVLDRGPGISGDIQERIFEPFFTTKTTGSGIGLAISRQFARAVDGDLRYHPREGGGSEFRLRFPAVNAHTAIRRPDDVRKA